MLKHLFWVSSRANRTEFLFWGIVFQGFFWILALLVPQPTFPPTAGQLLGSILLILLSIPGFWLGMALAVRRLHDMNLSGLWLFGLIFLSILINLIVTFLFPVGLGYPSGVLGIILPIIFLSIPGTPGENRFGTYDKHYYPAFMDRRGVWIFCVILVAVSQVTATVRLVKQERASQKRMAQFQKQMLQMQEQYRQQLMQVQGQESLSDEEKIKLFKEQIQKMQEQIRQQYEQQMQQQQQDQNKRSKSL